MMTATAHAHATLYDFLLKQQLLQRTGPTSNLVRYKVQAVVQQVVYQSQVHNVYGLKKRMDKSVTDNTIDKWHGSSSMCVGIL